MKPNWTSQATSWLFALVELDFGSPKAKSVNSQGGGVDDKVTVDWAVGHKLIDQPLWTTKLFPL